MKKLLVLISGCMISIILNANPITLPPVMSEFYIVNGSEWYLEISIDPMYSDIIYESSNLNGLEISSSSGSAIINDGIEFSIGEVIILTQDSMQTPLEFDRNNDFIGINNLEIGIYELYGFGNMQSSRISALHEGQSLVNNKYVCFDDSNFTEEVRYRLIKDNSPNISSESEPFTLVSGTGIFCGIVLDYLNNPVAGIVIGDEYYGAPSDDICGYNMNSALTDENGCFSVEEYSCNYRTKVYYSFEIDNAFIDTTVVIEPATDNYYEFHLDTVITDIKTNKYKSEIDFKAYPNPGNGNIYFNYNLSRFSSYDEALIKIYNQIGEIVKIIPAKIEANESSIVHWEGTCTYQSAPSGQYICKLELNGKSLAETKLIITK